MVTIFVDIFENLDSTLNTYTSDVIEAVITDITPVVSVMLTIYMMLWGWLTIRGQINEFVTDGFTRIVRLTIIVAIALNIGHYNGFVGDFLTALPDHLLAITANGAATTTGEYLDNTINEIWAAGWAFKNKSDELSTLGVSDFALTAIALFVWGLGIFLTAIAAFLLILSKMALAVLVSVGPIFIILTMFESTKRFFDAWLGQCFNFIIISLLVGGVLRLIIGFTLTEIADLDLLNKDDIEAFDSVSIIGYSLIGIYVLRQILPIASALGGGIALSTLGAGRSLYNATKSGLSSAKNTPKNVMKGIQSTQRGYQNTKHLAQAAANRLRGNNSISRR